MPVLDQKGNWVINTFAELWITIVLYTIVGTAGAFYVAGCWGCRVLNKSAFLYVWLPLVTAVIGACLGFLCGVITALFIAATYTAIPYDVPLSIAIGLGLSQALLIVYFYLGRADFVYQG